MDGNAIRPIVMQAAPVKPVGREYHADQYRGHGKTPLTRPAQTKVW